MKTAIIIGNGPSTKPLYEYGLKNIPEEIDTFCTSLAYRFCDELDFQPTYYVFADPKSVNMQKNNLKERIKKYKKTKTWFLCTDMCQDDFNEYSSEDKKQSKLIRVKHAGSGPMALNIAINFFKYDRIFIFGLDHNYTWIKSLVEFTGFKNCAVYLNDVVNHPSYFFPRYLKKGDLVSWDMNAKDGEKVIKKCWVTEKIINNGIKNGCQVIDFSDNIIPCPKANDLSIIFKNYSNSSQLELKPDEIIHMKLN